MCIHLDTMRALVKRADEQKMTEERHTLRDPRMLLRDKEKRSPADATGYGTERGIHSSRSQVLATRVTDDAAHEITVVAAAAAAAAAAMNID